MQVARTAGAVAAIGGASIVDPIEIPGIRPQTADGYFRDIVCIGFNYR